MSEDISPPEETPPLVKLLNVGDSGTGKTGALISLILAGFNIYMLDYDHGSEILINILLEDCPQALSGRRLIQGEIVSLRDKVRLLNGAMKWGARPTAYTDASRVLSRWDEKGLSHRDVFVLDTLNTFSDAGYREAQVMSGTLNQNKSNFKDYGWMADSVLMFIDMITAPSFPCHVIVNTHIRRLAAEEEQMLLRPSNKTTDDNPIEHVLGLPEARGQQIPRNVSKFFNTSVLSHITGEGRSVKRVISTIPSSLVMTKTSNPRKVKPSYPVESGMADLFRDLIGAENMPSTSQTKGAT